MHVLRADNDWFILVAAFSVCLQRSFLISATCQSDHKSLSFTFMIDVSVCLGYSNPSLDDLHLHRQNIDAKYCVTPRRIRADSI